MRELDGFNKLIDSGNIYTGLNFNQSNIQLMQNKQFKKKAVEFFNAKDIFNFRVEIPKIIKKIRGIQTVEPYKITDLFDSIYLDKVVYDLTQYNSQYSN